MITPNSGQDVNSSTSTSLGQQGQTFFEFMLLLMMVVLISLVTITGFRRGVRGYWRGAVFLLCVHGQTDSTVRDKCDAINQ